jgi:retron-type reverse transcriptase
MTPDPAEQRGSAPRRIELQEGTMSDATTSWNKSPELMKVAERAKRQPDQRILALAHLIDEPALERAFRALRRDAAVGVDGVTVEQYGGQLAANLQALRTRMKAGQYRHQPIRRVNIPKENGATRPIGVSTIEDKIVQGALRDVLEAVYEQDFLDCSYGFRPGRSAHGAIRTLNGVVMRGHANYIVEADIVSFFDNIDRKMLMEMLRSRIADERLMRLVGKCLHVGVLDGTRVLEPSEGTAQGSSLSPLLGNVYLYHVLDVWFEREVRPHLQASSALVRYADDFVMCFEHVRVGHSRAAVQDVWADPPPEEDAQLRLSASQGRGPRAGCDLRLPRLHAALAADEMGSVAGGIQDSWCASWAGNQGRRRVVSKSSPPLGRGAAPGALAQADRALQLLRGERQRPGAAEPALRGGAGMEEVAQPKKSASANGLEAVQGAPPSSPSSGRQDQSADLAHSVRRPDRRAGWWKTPCPDLARAPVGNGRGYSTIAFRQHSDASPMTCASRRITKLEWHYQTAPRRTASP